MQKAEAQNIPSIKEVNYLYLITMILFVLFGESVSYLKPLSVSYKTQIIFISSIQLLFVFIPVIIFLITRKISIKKTLRLNKVSLINILLTIALMIVAIPITTILNSIIVIILSFFGKVHAPMNLPSDTVIQLFINIFVIALIPAIFEELFFRGTVFKGYEKLGIKSAIIISSLMFGLMHRDIQNLLGTTILGMIIAYIVYRTNSLFAGMIAHFTNNAVVVLFGFAVGKLPSSLQESDKIINPININALNSIDSNTVFAIIIFVIGILIFFTMLVGIFMALTLLLKYTTRNISHEQPQLLLSKVSNSTYNPLIISLFFVIYEYIKQLI